MVFRHSLPRVFSAYPAGSARDKAFSLARFARDRRARREREKIQKYRPGSCQILHIGSSLGTLRALRGKGLFLSPTALEIAEDAGNRQVACCQLPVKGTASREKGSGFKMKDQGSEGERDIREVLIFPRMRSAANLAF